MEIIADNQSNQELKNVSVSDGEKSFVFGVMGGNGEAGYGTAERLFGTKVPEKLMVTFETVDGKKFVREVSFPVDVPGRTLRFVISPDFVVTGKREK